MSIAHVIATDLGNAQEKRLSIPVVEMTLQVVTFATSTANKSKETVDLKYNKIVGDLTVNVTVMETGDVLKLEHGTFAEVNY